MKKAQRRPHANKRTDMALNFTSSPFFLSLFLDLDFFFFLSFFSFPCRSTPCRPPPTSPVAAQMIAGPSDAMVGDRARQHATRSNMRKTAFRSGRRGQMCGPALARTPFFRFLSLLDFLLFFFFPLLLLLLLSLLLSLLDELLELLLLPLSPESSLELLSSRFLLSEGSDGGAGSESACAGIRSILIPHRGEFSRRALSSVHVCRKWAPPLFCFLLVIAVRCPLLLLLLFIPRTHVPQLSQQCARRKGADSIFVKPRNAQQLQC